MSNSTINENKTLPKKKGRSLPPKLIIWLGMFVWTILWRIMMSKLAPTNKSGAYIRPSSQFRNFIGTEEGNPYQPAAGRYRLYVGLGCPWAHRTLVVRSLKKLQAVISVCIVSPSPIEGGWIFNEQEQGCRTLVEFYQRAEPGYSGRVTVPILWIIKPKPSLIMRVQRLLLCSTLK